MVNLLSLWFQPIFPILLELASVPGSLYRDFITLGGNVSIAMWLFDSVSLAEVAVFCNSSGVHAAELSGQRKLAVRKTFILATQSGMIDDWPSRRNVLRPKARRRRLPAREWPGW